MSILISKYNRFKVLLVLWQITKRLAIRIGDKLRWRSDKETLSFTRKKISVVHNAKIKFFWLIKKMLTFLVFNSRIKPSKLIKATLPFIDNMMNSIATWNWNCFTAAIYNNFDTDYKFPHILFFSIVWWKVIVYTNGSDIETAAAIIPLNFLIKKILPINICHASKIFVWYLEFVQGW